MKKTIFFLLFVVSCLNNNNVRLTDKTEVVGETYADAHNHINGVLPVEVINTMLRNVCDNWKINKNKFDVIPKCLIKDSEKLDLSEKSENWIDSLDVLCRIIVLSIVDIENKDIKGYQRKSKDSYCKKVQSMLLMGEKSGNFYYENPSNKKTLIKSAGRGVYGLGLVLSSCISLRFLLDMHLKGEGESDFNCYREFIEFMGKGDKKLSQLFKRACLIKESNLGSKAILESNWLFTELKNKSGRLEELINLIAKAGMEGALKSTPLSCFDDCYAIRGLLRCDEEKDVDKRINEANWTMLTFKWLYLEETKNKNYYSEISIGLGSLKETLQILCGASIDKYQNKNPGEQESNLSKFGFEKINLEEYDVTSSNPIYGPLVFKSRRSIVVAIRFLTGFANKKSLDEKSRKDIEKNIEKDSRYGCWAGIDMFGIENYSYDKKQFCGWLDFIYEKLFLIMEKSKWKHKLWLRPHVGEGSWASDYEKRMSKIKRNPYYLTDDNGKYLNNIMKNNSIHDVSQKGAIEIMEFIYMSMFQSWFPRFLLEQKNREFAFNELKFFFLEKTSSRKEDFEWIGEANLSTIIGWIDRKEKLKKHSPLIRLGHATRLKNEVLGTMEKIGSLKKEKKNILWIDLNLISNAVTGANPFNELMEGSFNEGRTRSGNFKAVESRALSNPIESVREQDDLVRRSDEVKKFVEYLIENDIKFILGTDGQGVESSSIYREYDLFTEIAKSVASRVCQPGGNLLRKNVNNYLKYGAGNLEKKV